MSKDIEKLKQGISVEEARSLLLSIPVSPEGETVPVEHANGRVLARDMFAPEQIPPFARSPFDGYALRAEDTKSASRENPVTLSITEEIPAGKAPEFEIKPGFAAKILTGAPVPVGADTTIKYEETEFTTETVTLFAPLQPGKNIVGAGEDVRIGDRIAEAGTVVTPPVAGLLAGLGICNVPVFRKPVVAIVNTGDELLYAHEPLRPGKIRNSSCYTLRAYLEERGAVVIDGGTAKDRTEDIAAHIEEAIKTADMVVTTGGVSVGDYDLVLSAAKHLGAEILYWKTLMKPGGSGLAAVYRGKLILGLSGNPAAAVVSLLIQGMPFVRRLAGCREVLPEKLRVRTLSDFPKNSPQRRFLRGRLVVTEGTAGFLAMEGQGNGVISSLVGCDLIGEIPAGSPPLPAGSLIDAYRV